MEPFSIRCGTCAAKLKVTNPSAVGQKLACPKCGSMILVEAPEGWQPPEDAPASEQSLAADSSGEFDDIDQILKQKEESRKQQRPVRKKAVQPQKPTQRPQSVPATEAVPVLPNESWTASTTQKRQRNILIGAGLIGILVIGGAIFAAINVGGRKDTPTQVAENPEDENLPSENKEQTTDDGSETKTEADVETPTLETKDPEIAEPDSPEQPDNESPVENASADPTEINPENGLEQTENTTSNPQEDETNGDDENQNSPADETDDKPDEPSSPFDSSLDEFLSLPLTDVDDVETNFDDLSELLERGGSSLFEINQFALLSSKQRRIGLPKYFIKFPKTIDPRNLQRLNDPVKGIQYNNHSFLQVLAEVTEMTGVPITYDTENLIFEEVDFGFNLQDFRVTDTTFAGLLNSALSTSGSQLVLEYDGNSAALITVEQRNILQTETITLPDLQKISPENFASLIQQMISPGTWKKDPTESLLEIDGASLRVVHRTSVVEKVRRFVQKWNVGLKVKNDELPASELDSRWVISEGARSANTSIDLASDMPILELTAALKRDNDTNLLVDFESLLPLGWNPNTEIPFGFTEPNVEQLISEIAHSMDVAYRAIDAKTFELLSKERLQELTEVEFYSCSKILAGQLNQQQLFELVRQSLQSANRLDGSTRAYFEAEIECFIVVGSQDVQKLIHSVLQRLENLN